MKVQTLIIEYADIAIEEVITYGKSDDKRYRKLKGNATFWRDLSKVMAIIRAASNTSDLEHYASLHYEKLKHDKSGLSSVRIGYNTKYRLF